MTRSVYAIGVAVALILIATISIVADGESGSEMENDNNKTRFHKFHTPISIGSDDDFDDLISDEGWLGTGTDQDPYVIKDLEINASGYGFGIMIKDTSRIFSIEKCRIYGAKDIDCNWGYGIFLKNVNVFTIIHCYLHDNYGSAIYADRNNGGITCSISTNEIMGSGTGINMKNMKYLLISQNKIYDNAFGISLTESSNFYIYENEVLDNSIDGIQIIGNHKGGVSRNLVMNNGRFGLISQDSYDNLIFENSFISNNGATEDFDDLHLQAADYYDSIKSRNSWKSHFGNGNHWRDWLIDGFNNSEKPYPLDGGITLDSAPLAESMIEAPPSRIMDFSSVRYSDCIILKWKEPVDTGPSGISDYILRRVVEIDAPSETSISLGGDYLSYEDTDIDLEGAYSYSIQAVNSKGEGLSSKSISVISDRTPPHVEITFPMDGVILESKIIRINWTAEDDLTGLDRSEITLNEGPWLDVGNDLSYDLTLVETGSYHFMVKVFDKAGNNNTDEVSFELDDVPPEIFIKWNYTGTIINRSHFEIGFDALDEGSDVINYNIKVDEDDWIQLGNTNRTVIENLADGDHILRISAIDLIGNSAEKILDFVIDTGSPHLQIISPVEGLISKTAGISLQWDSHDPISGVWNNTIRIDNGPWIDVYQWKSFSISYLNEGSHTAEVRIYDCAGHQTTSSVTFVIDMEFPRILDTIPDRPLVGRESVVSVQFSEPMDVSRTYLKVVGIGGISTWNGMSLTYEPIGPYEVGMTYRVEVMGYDMGSNRLDPYTWDFTILPDSSIGDYLIVGNVINENGPIDNASIHLDGYYITRTDNNGGFNFKTSEGIHNILIRKSGITVYNRSFTVGNESITRMGNIAIDIRDETTINPSDLSEYIPAVIGLILGLIIIVSITLFIIYFRNRSDFEVEIMDGGNISIDGEIYHEPGISSTDENNLRIMFDFTEGSYGPDNIEYQPPVMTAEEMYGSIASDDITEDPEVEDPSDLSDDDIIHEEEEFEIDISGGVVTDLDLSILDELEDMKVDERFTWKDLANPLYERSVDEDQNLEDLDCYMVLGIDPYSTRNAVRLAYRKLAREYHPDRISRHDRTLKSIAGEEMKKLNYAKETLLDPERRAAHDLIHGPEND